LPRNVKSRSKMHKIPGYIYEKNQINKTCLSQGDIIKIDQELRLRFRKYYPEIELYRNFDCFAMVISQSCDLMRTEGSNKELPDPFDW
jgi:hypothetical protein